MELNSYKRLIDGVNSLISRYELISTLTGENFNVFRILKLESSEVKLHSAFLAELLSPKGSHGQKDIFLELFINMFCFKKNPIETHTCEAVVELHTGFLNEDKTKGGRIDIIITDRHNHQIIIENKIFAPDQDKQMLRYHTYNNKADLFYLTLDGKSPPAESAANLKENIDFRCLSYRYNIIEWLEACRKEVSIYPIVRESITQYVNLIKYLTGQTINNSMEKELRTLMKHNIEASFIIKNNLDSALNELLKEYTHQLEEVCISLELKCSNLVNFNERYSGFWIWKDKWQFANIGFQFTNHNNRELVYGICVKGELGPDNFPPDLRTKINDISDNSTKNDAWWPWRKMMESPYNDWSNFEAWKAVEDGKMLNNMKQKIEMLLQLIDKAKIKL